VQTFLPYPDFLETAKCLDWQRLGKQRSEGKQILNCLYYRKNNDLYMIDKNGRKRRRGWIDHVAVKMWIGYEEALKSYINAIIYEWISRGYNNNMPFYEADPNVKFELPHWIGDEAFHASHRSNLLRKANETYIKRIDENRKNPNELIEWYSQFKWEEPANLPYVWPGGKDVLCKSIAS